MSLRVRYFDHLTDVNSTIDLGPYIRVPGFSVAMNAEEGSVGLSTITVDDPLGTLDFVGMRRIFVTETSESPTRQHLYNGFLADATISRGPEAGLDADIHVTGSARRWTLNVADVNSLIPRKLIRSGGSRPSETDLARIAWLISSRNLGPIGNAAGLIATTGGVTMDAVDYTGQTAWDVLNDCAQHSGRLWFAFLYEQTNHYSLFYNNAGSDVYDSGCKLTNVEADANGTSVFMVLDDARLVRDPSRLADGISVPYNGGSVYVQNTTTGNTYFGADYSRDLVMPHANTSSIGAATAIANRYLTDASTPDDRVFTSYIVAKESVNAIKEGQRVLHRYTHFPVEYAQSYTYARVLKRTVTQLTDDRYQVDVELATSLIGEPGPPASPTAAQAALYAPTNKDSIGGGGGSIVEPRIDFIGTGDGPDRPSGSAEIPLIGSLSYIQSGSWPGAGTHKYTGIKVNGNGTLDIRFKSTFTMVVNTSHPTMTWSVHVNGLLVGSYSLQETACTGLCAWSPSADFTVYDIPVSTNDIITARMELTGSLGFTVPSGVGNPALGLFVEGELT